MGDLLLVEKDEKTRTLLKRILGNSFRVDSAKTLEEGINKVGENCYRLVITNLEFPNAAYGGRIIAEETRKKGGYVIGVGGSLPERLEEFDEFYPEWDRSFLEIQEWSA
ncbi:hypothetical protein K0A97_02720 [Patescibacteria group bacterium]|nr:hypothetical protein [Patescibacteria group bacterium]